MAHSVHFKPMEQVPIEFFRAGLGNYINIVCRRRTSFMVTRNGTPYVTLSPVAPESSNEPAPSTETVSALAIRRHTAHLLGRVHFQNLSLLVMRRGRPVAVLSSANKVVR